MTDDQIDDVQKWRLRAAVNRRALDERLSIGDSNRVSCEWSCTRNRSRSMAGCVKLY